MGQLQPGHGDKTPEQHAKQFYYEEHSCPTNWLEPEVMAIGGDLDPHGAIQYVRHIDDASLPPDEMPGCGRQLHEWLPVFPELK